MRPYQNSGALMMVRVAMGESITFSDPVGVSGRALSAGGYDVVSDGRFVLAIDSPDMVQQRERWQIDVVLNSDAIRGHGLAAREHEGPLIEAWSRAVRRMPGWGGVAMR